jgi:hypothetical protein
MEVRSRASLYADEHQHYYFLQMCVPNKSYIHYVDIYNQIHNVCVFVCVCNSPSVAITCTAGMSNSLVRADRSKLRDTRWSHKILKYRKALMP